MEDMKNYAYTLFRTIPEKDTPYSGVSFFIDLPHELFQGLLNICGDIINIFNAHREANEVGCNTRFTELFICKLSV